MTITQTTNAAATPAAPDTVAALAASHPAKAAVAAVASAAGSSPAAAKKAVEPSQTDLKNSVDQINRFLKVNSEVEFSIDHASGKSVIKVVDTETNKVLRQFPSEQALEIGQNLQDSKSGLINVKA
ncbi:flagellar protein FlaG [Rugamonas sp.]|uniref:flagellar protein FlaG n=1 Tax=Rugamonas sp. TaxID=1926287 RepID=UPI0025D70AC3|nr:flagellar protein FlaG [Rugamonas sp.]